jgi:hypothetical protein
MRFIVCVNSDLAGPLYVAQEHHESVLTNDIMLARLYRNKLNANIAAKRWDKTATMIGLAPDAVEVMAL